MPARYSWFFKTLVFIGRQTLCRYLSVTCHGLDRLPSNSQFIIASSHRSTLDPVLILLYFLPHLQGMVSPAATRGLFVGPLGWVMRKMGAIEIDRTTRRNLSNIRQILQTLKKNPILIFPEGGIVTPPERRSGQPGVAFMAEHAAVPVLPVAMIGTHLALPKGGRWIRKRKIQIEIGSALIYNPGGETHRQFTDRIMASIETMDPVVDQLSQ